LASAVGIDSQGGTELACEVAVAVTGAWVCTCGLAGCAAEAAVDATATPNAGVAAPIPDPTGFAVDERPMFLLSMPVVASALDEAADWAAGANAEPPGREGEIGAASVSDAAATGNAPVVPAETAAGMVVETVKSVLPGVPAGVTEVTGTDAPEVVDDVAGAASDEFMSLVGPAAIVEGVAVADAAVWAGEAPLEEEVGVGALDANVAGRAVTLSELVAWAVAVVPMGDVGGVEFVRVVVEPAATLLETIAWPDDTAPAVLARGVDSVECAEGVAELSTPFAWADVAAPVVPTADVGDAEFAEGSTEPLAALLDVAAPVVFTGRAGTAETAKGVAELLTTLSEVVAWAADAAPLVFAGCTGAAELAAGAAE
jgi:hypothetical protein